MYADAPEWLAEVYDPWPRDEIARAGEVDLGSLCERADGIRARRHPAALLLEAPPWLLEVWHVFQRAPERDLRAVDVLERLNARAVDAWGLMLGAMRRRFEKKKEAGDGES